MIAVHEDPTNDMVLLFKTLRGYVGGNTDPVDFNSAPGRMRTLDENLAEIGYERVEDWRPVPDRAGAYFAKARPTKESQS